MATIAPRTYSATWFSSARASAAETASRGQLLWSIPLPDPRASRAGRARLSAPGGHAGCFYDPVSWSLTPPCHGRNLGEDFLWGHGRPMPKDTGDPSWAGRRDEHVVPRDPFPVSLRRPTGAQGLKLGTRNSGARAIGTERMGGRGRNAIGRSREFESSQHWVPDFTPSSLG